MPSVFGGGGTGGGQPPRAVDPTNKIGQSSNSQIIGAGQINVSLADPSTTIPGSIGNINAGFIGLGKGLVSLVENAPIIGGIAKPIIGLVGGVADATVGQVVKAAENVRVGDKNLAQAGAEVLEWAGTPLKWGLDAITWGGVETEKAIGRARILNTKNNQKDFITSIFGEAPQSALDAMSNGATLEDAAEQLAASNAGFSQNGAANFLWSLVLDPMNLIAPGMGKAFSMSAQAAKFAAIGADSLQTLEKTARVAGNLELAAKYADDLAFLNKYDWMGKIYQGTMGKMSLVTRRFSTTVAKEAALGWTRVHSVRAVNPLLDDIIKVAGREVVDRGLKNYATTFANAIKSGAIRLRATITRSNGGDFADRFIGHAISGVAEGKTRAEILAQAAGDSDIGKLLKDYGVPDEDIGKLFDVLEAKKGVRADELRRAKEVTDVREVIEKLAANARVAKEKDLIRRSAAFRADLDSRLASEEAIRVLRQDKDSRIPAAARREQGIEELTADLAAGFGLKLEVARELAIKQFDRFGNDVQSLADVLSVARGAAYGQSMRKLAVLRKAVAGKTITITTKNGDRVVDLGRLTITSTRSITESQTDDAIKRFDDLEATLTKATAEGNTELVEQTKKQLRDEADRLVSQFDDFGKRFSPGTYTYSEVRAYLGKSVNLTVQEISPLERAKIAAAAAKDPALRQVLEVEKDLEQLGYRLGFAPEDDLSKVQTVVTDHYGRETIDEVLMPFSDSLDHVAIDGLDDALIAEKLRPTKLGGIWEKLTRSYGPEVAKNNVAERFVTSMVQKTGVSVNKARQIFVEVNNIAAKRGAQQELGGGRLQGLFVVKSEVDEVFRRIMGDDFGKLTDAGTSPIKEIFSAAAGDWSVAGLTSGFTGRIKALAPEITILTDILYPEVRFGRLNPYFNLVLERTETEIQKIVHRIRGEVTDEFTGEIRGAVMRRAHLDPRNVNREINDGLVRLSEKATRATAATALGAQTFRKRVQDRVRKWLSIQGVKDTKEVARDITADQFAVREFIDILEQNAPGTLKKLAEHYGTTSADEVVELLLNEYLMHSDPILFAKHVAETGKVARRLSVDELVSPEESGLFKASINQRSVKSGDSVDGLIVRSKVPNTGSISATTSDWEEFGIRQIEIPDQMGKKPQFYSKYEKERTEQLAREIAENGEINPLIVVFDSPDNWYILEGGHRYDALIMLEKKSFPALVVRDYEAFPIKESASGLTREQAEAIVSSTIGAYETALLRASRAADRAQYFSNHRSWLERSMNHPFLAYYPYSYMTQKAIPSLLRFMFLSPGYKGQIWPGFWYNNWDKTMEYMENSLNSDPDLLTQILKDDAVIWTITSLLPVTPDRIGFAQPAWMRRGIIQPGLRGTPLTPGEIAPAFSEIVAQVGRGTVLGQARSTLEGIQGVEDAVKTNENIGDFIETQAQQIQLKALELRRP